MTTGTMCVVLGFLNRIPKANTFIALAECAPGVDADNGVAVDRR